MRLFVVGTEEAFMAKREHCSTLPGAARPKCVAPSCSYIAIYHNPAYLCRKHWMSWWEGEIGVLERKVVSIEEEDAADEQSGG